MKYPALMAVLVLFSASVFAEPTTIEVSVLSHGAKFIGDKTGGARITIEDSTSGDLLAEGITRGGTGDTGLIMRGSGGRWDSVTSEGAALFAADIDIDEPTRLVISAVGPLDAEHEMSKATTTAWLVPGDDRAGGDRIVMELIGYLVKPVEMNISADGKGSATVDLRMLCGCPIVPGGLWDANQVDMTARLQGSGDIETVALEHVEGTVYRAGFSGAVENPQSMEFRLQSQADANSTVARFEL